MKTTVKQLSGLVLGGLLLSSGSMSFAQANEKIKVVTSFSILQDLVSQVGGDRVQVSALVGVNADMHAFSPKPSDAKAVLSAKLVVINGLGFEPWAEKLVNGSGFAGVAVVASKGVKALEVNHDHGHGHGHGHSHGHGKKQEKKESYDPHAWQDVGNVKIYVRNIAEGLAQVDGAGAATYKANADKYLAQLDALQSEIKSGFAAMPVEKRKVMTSHEAFAYFGEAYNVQFFAPQGSSASQASAKGVAKIIDQIRKEKISAVFLENMSDKKLITKIAQESGAKIGGTLYADALGGAAKSYIEMMRHNAKTILSALQ